jgi:hypothetical protein
LCEAARGWGAESDAAALACRARIAQTEGYLRATESFPYSTARKPFNQHRPLNQMPPAEKLQDAVSVASCGRPHSLPPLSAGGRLPVKVDRRGDKRPAGRAGRHPRRR